MTANILLALINAGVSVFVYNSEQLQSMSWISLVLSLIIIYLRKSNILFMLRTVIIIVIGYYPIFIKNVFGADALFSGVEYRTQGLEIAVVVYLSTSLALLGSEIGFNLSAKKRMVIRPYDESNFWRMIFYLCIPIVIYVGYVVVRGYGASIFVQQYAQCTTCEPIPLGVTQGIGIISLLSMYVASYKVKIRFSKVILICAAVYLLLWAMFFRGLRQDVVSALIGFAVCYGLVRGAPFKVRGVHIAPIAMLVAVVEIMGYVRRSIAVKGFDFPDMLRSLLHVANDDHHIGAISPLVTTFANIVYMVKNGVVEYLYGITYAQFIPRSPPAFLYPSRPTDYAWIFPEYGYLAIGGIYELAEAYLNAGLLGVFVFPAILSYLIGLSFYNAINKQTVFSYFIIFSVVALFIRGSFYQVFAFYKLLLTGLILYMIFWLFFEFFSAQRARLR